MDDSGDASATEEGYTLVSLNIHLVYAHSNEVSGSTTLSGPAASSKSNKTICHLLDYVDLLVSCHQGTTSIFSLNSHRCGKEKKENTRLAIPQMTTRSCLQKIMTPMLKFLIVHVKFTYSLVQKWFISHGDRG